MASTIVSSETAEPVKQQATNPQPSDAMEDSEKRLKSSMVQQADQNQAQASTMPAAGPRHGSSISTAAWKSRLMSHLERRKNSIGNALARVETRVAYVRFRIDGVGNVLAASLTRSSGCPDIDAEVVVLVRSASPVPAPPSGIAKTITIPIRFPVR